MMTGGRLSAATSSAATAATTTVTLDAVRLPINDDCICLPAAGVLGVSIGSCLQEHLVVDLRHHVINHLSHIFVKLG
jgi:hypothetical protein